MAFRHTRLLPNPSRRLSIASNDTVTSHRWQNPKSDCESKVVSRFLAYAAVPNNSTARNGQRPPLCASWLA